MPKKNKLGKKSYSILSGRLFNRSLYLEPSYGADLFKTLAARMSPENYAVSVPEEVKMSTPEDRENYANTKYAEWRMRKDGTAVLPITGTLTHDGAGANLMASLGRGYQSIIADAQSIAAREDVQRVAMLLGSNGGDVHGCGTCSREVKKIFSQAGLPVWGFADENAYSAGYWQIASADRVILPESGGAGSIGVITGHTRYEKMIEEAGMKITLITSGKKKATGHPYADLSEEDYKEIEDEILYYAGQFFDHVSEERGMSVDGIRDLEAGTFVGQQAVDAGLADEVMDISDFYAAFAEEAGRSQSTNTISIGSNKLNEQELQELRDKAAKADQLEKDNKDLKDKVDNASAKAETAQSEADNKAQRVLDVMGSEEAKGRHDQAVELLSDPKFASFSADDIKEQLSKYAVVEDKEEEEELHGDTQALLSTARKSASKADKITSVGEGGDPEAEKDDEDDDAYSDSVEKDRKEMMGSFLRSAKIVKNNLKRASI